MAEVDDVVQEAKGLEHLRCKSDEHQGGEGTQAGDMRVQRPAICMMHEEKKLPTPNQVHSLETDVVDWNYVGVLVTVEAGKLLFIILKILFGKMQEKCFHHAVNVRILLQTNMTDLPTSTRLIASSRYCSIGLNLLPQDPNDLKIFLLQSDPPPQQAPQLGVTPAQGPRRRPRGGDVGAVAMVAGRRRNTQVHVVEVLDVDVGKQGLGC
mmetsp:Transcript_9587/g.32115  ORF Transcript_9587/g.32115 Transcript_9587/m.32115 type:complete len:209 (+) Transcript_9587:821-1447(+)